MARERKYGWNGELPAKEVGGQCKIVLDGLRAFEGEMRTGHEWTELVGGDLRTKQDPYRVVLYYILILKSKGCIATEEFDINATTKKDGEKHGITTSTAPRLVKRHVVPEVTRNEIDEMASEMQEAIGAALDAL